MVESSCVGQPLTFTSFPITRVAVGEVYRYEVKAVDATGHRVFISAPSIPPWLRFDTASAVLQGISSVPGQYAVQLVVRQGSMRVTQNFMVTVCDAQTKNILFLGNSITNGTDKYNSYRRPLWKLLREEQYNFDLVGSWDKHHSGGTVPDADFDLDHEGHSGWTAHQMMHPPAWDSTRGNIHMWLQQYAPDIVLIELGTNDVFQCRTAAEFTNDLREIITILRSRRAAVKIIIVSVLPLGKKWASQNLCGTEPYGKLIRMMNDAIHKFAPLNTGKESPITVVDIDTGMDPDTDMYDGIHPNDKGEKILAARFFPVIAQYLNKL